MEAARGTSFSITASEEPEWTADAVISFINDLQGLPILWDSRSPQHKMGRIKTDVWLQLGSKYKFPPDELKRKWQSLQAAYRREKMRELSSRGQYKSRWFAYGHMNFVGDRYRPRKIIGPPEVATYEIFGAKEEARSEEEEEQQFVGEYDPAVETEDLTVPTVAAEDIEGMQSHVESISQPRTFISRSSNSFIKKKFQPYEISSGSQAYSVSKQQERDEYTIFGEYIAKKLAKMDDRLCAIVQHEIHNILFQAEMGQFGDYSLSAQGAFITSDLESAHTVHSPSSTSHNSTVYEANRSQ